MSLNMEEDYKTAKESFVSGMSGSSIGHINLICLTALVSVSLYAAIRTRTPPSQSINFFASWAILVLPMLLSMTIAAGQPLYLVIVLGIALWIVLQLPKMEVGTPLPSSVPSSPSKPQHKIVKPRINPLPALTTYRAHMMLMTVLAILAVDFPVFPRYFAKCETFGVSLMDLGVGSFVFSQGIVSAIPLIRDPKYITAPLFPKLLTVTKKSLPVIALGVIRVLLVKGTEYPEHVTEYGAHWNFFITLALTPILQVLLHPLFSVLPISAVGVVVAGVQQLALSQLHLRDYVLSAPRTSLISANKEGLVSLPGYLAIQLLGLSVGTLVLPPTPSFFRRQQAALASHQKTHKRRSSDPVAQTGKGPADVDLDLDAPRQMGKLSTELSAYSILWWSLLGLARATRIDGRWSQGEGVSRQMVNISYILWIAAFNTSFLLSYIVALDLWIFAAPSKSKSKHSTKGRKAKTLNTLPHLPDQRRGLTVLSNGNPPKLLEVLNKHGLASFLLANVLTGAVNLSFATMYMSDFWALVILSVYSIVVCAVPWMLEARRRGDA